MEVTTIPRKFVMSGKGNDITLDDPNPEMNADDVMQFYAGTYPELNNASVTGPELEEGKAVYKMKTVIGTKG